MTMCGLVTPCMCCTEQVALNACSMTMCGLMLESILESASDFVSVSEEALFMQRCRLFAARYLPCFVFAVKCTRTCTSQCFALQCSFARCGFKRSMLPFSLAWLARSFCCPDCWQSSTLCTHQLGVAAAPIAATMGACHFIGHARSFKLGDRPPAPPRMFSKHWEARCEGEFQRAFYMFSASAHRLL